MSLATTTLPTDPEALRAFAAQLQAELYAKTLHIEKLKAELALLKRARYGRSSERIEQLELLIGELEADEAEHEAKEPAAAPDKPRSTGSAPRGRQPLPAHLPRERVEHTAACVCPACGSTRLSRIGSDEREILEYVPSHFKVVGHGAALLQALADGITRHVKVGSALHADDTPVPVLDPGRQRTKTGRLWVLVRDERPWGGPAPPAVSYLYSPDRPPRPAGRVSSGDRIKGLLALDG